MAGTRQPVRTLIRLTLIVAAGVLVVGCARAVGTGELQGEVVEPPEPKPSFTLTDTDGEAYEFSERTEGKLTLLYFGYLNCPDICPVHLAQIAEVFSQVPAVARNTEVVFVSVDPDRDTPEAIRDYLDRFDHRFVGLTGTTSELEEAQTAANVPLAYTVGDDENYAVEHAAWVIAFAPDGRNHAIYPFGTRQTTWRNDLPILADIEAVSE